MDRASQIEERVEKRDVVHEERNADPPKWIFLSIKACDAGTESFLVVDLLLPASKKLYCGLLRLQLLDLTASITGIQPWRDRARAWALHLEVLATSKAGHGRGWVGEMTTALPLVWTEHH